MVFGVLTKLRQVMLAKVKNRKITPAFLQCQSIKAPPIALSDALAMEFAIMKTPITFPRDRGVVYIDANVMNGASTNELPNVLKMAEKQYCTRFRGGGVHLRIEVMQVNNRIHTSILTSPNFLISGL